MGVRSAYSPMAAWSFVGTSAMTCRHLPGVPGHDPRGDGGGDALLPAGVGHHHALYVLDDIPGDVRLDPLGQGPQQLPQPGAA